MYNTASVITKSTAVGSTLENRAAVENLFPGLNFDNFYYQIARLKNTSFISVCKQTELNDLIQKLKELKINLVGISLGPSSLSTILGYLKEDLIYTHTDKITLTDAPDTSISISKTSESVPTGYHLNGLEVTNADLLSFGGVVHFFDCGQGSGFQLRGCGGNPKEQLCYQSDFYTAAAYGHPPCFGHLVGQFFGFQPLF